jgi:hypothetical protein
MMTEENEQLAGLINKDFATVEDGMLIPLGGSIDRDSIREKLAFVIAHLMEHNFEKLCQAMYRLDVSERKFDEVLTREEPERIAYSLADLVIEREMQKVRTRIMYKRKEL